MTVWDVAVVGAGPAGSVAALAVLAHRPGSRVLLLDRADFPRDKACGDGVAPHVLDVLGSLGMPAPSRVPAPPAPPRAGGILADRVPVHRLALRAGDSVVDRPMARPALVVPRAILDDRLRSAALDAGAEPRRLRVRSVRTGGGAVRVVDGAGEQVQARVVVGADGVRSAVRAAAGVPAPTRVALALRGYAPVRADLAGRQVITFGDGAAPDYAWSFPVGDGTANVGYGRLLAPGRPPPTRAGLLAELDRLLPGVSDGGHGWRAAHLPLSSSRTRHPDGPVLLAGDAAALVNPMTGEGIYDAVVSGALAGRSAAHALDAGEPAAAGAAYRRVLRSVTRRHQRHTGGGARLLAVPGVARAAVRAAAADPRTFDDLVEVGLAHGVLTPRAVTRVLLALRGRP